jgi:competence protein ComEC
VSLSAAAPGTWALPVAVAACAAALAATRRLGPARVSPWLVAALALLAGVARHEAWEARPDPVAPLLDRELTWRGRYDGEWFRSTAPVTARLALVAREEPPAGELEVVGTARLAPGKRNPGGFDYRAYLARRGVGAQLFVSEVRAVAPREGVRQRLARGVGAGLDAGAAGLMLAMTLGVRDGLRDRDRDAFGRAGLAHVLALSGLHFGVLLAAADAALRRLGARRRPLLALLTLGFVGVVGPSPSVVRAAAMALAALFSLAAGVGRLRPWPVLSLAACASLLLQPQMLFDLSFRLSYLALGGLLLFAGPLARLLGAPEAGDDPLATPPPGPAGGGVPHRLRAFAARALAASVAAQLPSVSLVAGSFGVVPVLSPLVNLVGVPLSALVVPLGLAAGLLGLVWEPLAGALNLVTGALVASLTRVAEWGARLPAVAWPEVSWLGHLCWAVAVASLALALRRRLRASRALAVLLVAGAAPYAVGSPTPPPDVWFLDVGQGDAALVRLAGRYEVLIDGGGTPFSDYDVGEGVVVPALRALDVDELEVVVATHADADHVEGLLSVLRDVPVGTLVTGPRRADAPLDQELRRLAAERGVAVHVAARGEALVVGRHGEARFEVLHPPAGAGGHGNEDSVVLLLRLRGQAVALFLGDAGAATERELAVPRVHVLKVGHHGSRFGTTDELLWAARPRLAVISVGENGYGHPHPSVLERLDAHGVPVATTREAGAVRVPLGRVPLAR